MLSIITAPAIRPEVETIDRDPGIVSLVSALVRSARANGTALAAHVRSAHQHANEAELFSSSNAWPHNTRSR